jgi:hypothetical protein
MRGAIATTLVALTGAVLFVGIEGERFATTAYLAAIFAGLMLLGLCVVSSEARTLEPPQNTPSFPAALAFWLVVTGVLLAGVALADDPSGEAVLALVCLLLVALAALFPAGLFAPVHARLVEGGALAGATRYAVALALTAFVSSALFPIATSGEGAVVGFWCLAAAGVMIFASRLQFVATAFAGRGTGYGKWLIGELTREAFVERVIRYVVLACVAAFAIAASFPALGGRAAFVGYVAAIAAGAVLVVKQRYALSRGGSADA